MFLLWTIQPKFWKVSNMNQVRLWDFVYAMPQGKNDWYQIFFSHEIFYAVFSWSTVIYICKSIFNALSLWQAYNLYGAKHLKLPGTDTGLAELQINP